jgi:hypothetical protein
MCVRPIAKCPGKSQFERYVIETRVVRHTSGTVSSESNCPYKKLVLSCMAYHMIKNFVSLVKLVGESLMRYSSVLREDDSRTGPTS